ncbi:zinc transport system ATP-binding protein [Limimonas halophila]|uniref:Zinc transport system ATP-binding protein n=1 Tax=Limimonas halophila TaxID=1082479 RepID=A0A1G7M7V4_9PROT|nr:zinc ABC transporter ATP-binding protein ZnuC [Limimonas halophila]SDF57771.1 zinc transport system ATP-binding protein [Limimonas halophila]
MAATDNAEPLVRVRGVRVGFSGTRVLDDVDLDLAPGRTVTIIGPNGAGKTTLARVVLGLQRPHAGKVHRRKGLSVGYVPQRFALDWTLPITVAHFLGLPKRYARHTIGAALSEVGVGYTQDKPVQSLSGGEFQRVMLARALLRRPNLLVLDEPMQGVDLGGQLDLFDLIGRLRTQHGFAVLMVSHDLHLVMRGTEEVVCLNHHVCCRGQPESVSQHPEYLHLFGTAAARAAAVYAHTHHHKHTPSGEVVPAEAGADACPETEPQ